LALLCCACLLTVKQGFSCPCVFIVVEALFFFMEVGLFTQQISVDGHLPAREDKLN
jgi:hypothetical protein